jgi:hypothetical protein
LEILPSFVEITTIASIVLFVAWYHIFWRDDHVDGTFWLNTESIWECLTGSESPAWTALLLVSDGVNAVWPLDSSIKVSWCSGGWLLVDWEEWVFRNIDNCS